LLGGFVDATEIDELDDPRRIQDLVAAGYRVPSRQRRDTSPGNGKLAVSTGVWHHWHS